MDDAITTAIEEGFGRASVRLADITAVAQWNAMLALTDPELVLPSPAMGLLAVEPARTRALAPEDRFRSLGYASHLGEVLFTALDAGFEVHPWRVASAVWRLETGDDAAATGERLAQGLVIRLERAPETLAGPGWLSLHLEGGPWLEWALEGATVSVGGRPAAIRRGTESLTGARARDATGAEALPGQAWPMWHTVGAMAAGLLSIQIPRERVADTKLVVDVQFTESIPAEADPEAMTNVGLVWNSLFHGCPEPGEIAERASQPRDRWVFPLSTRSLGAGWMPWRVDRVRPTDDRAPMRPRTSGPLPGHAPDHLLAFLPAADGDDHGSPRLSVVLTRSGRERLDRGDQRLQIAFRATQGGAANHVPAGTPFELVTGGDPFATALAPCRMLIETFGGADGPAAIPETTAAGTMRALLPRPRVRSATDVREVLRMRFPQELELVDAWDLLPWDGPASGEPLSVRVRFLRPHRPARERRVMLAAAGSFLRQYLGPTPVGDFQLADVDAVAGAAR
jgi:hypothetical protein